MAALDAMSDSRPYATAETNWADTQLTQTDFRLDLGAYNHAVMTHRTNTQKSLPDWEGGQKTLEHCLPSLAQVGLAPCNMAHCINGHLREFQIAPNPEVAALWAEIEDLLARLKHWLS